MEHLRQQRIFVHNKTHSYTDDGFVINAVHMDGAVLTSGTLFTLWNVQTVQDITPDALALLLLLRPPPGVWVVLVVCSTQYSRPTADLLIVGTGRQMQPLSQAVRDFCRQNMVSVEVLSTVRVAWWWCFRHPLPQQHAVSTFNILNMEARSVAAAMLPYSVG